MSAADDETREWADELPPQAPTIRPYEGGPVPRRACRPAREELAQRPGADATERRLLYRAIFACSFAGSLQAVLQMEPDVRSLPNLASVIDRWSACAHRLRYARRRC
jgi:hypothetical protein